MRPLEGIKVVELATVLAGPEVGRFLAELGATVIKYEPPGGDVTRGWRLADEDQTTSISAYFAAVNAQKTYNTLDLKSDEGKAALTELLEEADILLSNFKPSDETKFGLTKDDLATINPRLIWGRIRGFASTPNRPAFDVVLQAETGWISMTGTSANQLAKIPVALVDVLAAHQLKEALLIALLERQNTGRGSYWEVSLEEASLSGLANQATNFWMNQHVAQPMGTGHPNIAPYGDLLPTVDGKWAVPAIGSQAQFSRFCELLGKAEISRDIRFRSNIDRVTNRTALIKELSELTRTWESEILSNRCMEENIPVGIVRTMDEVLSTSTAREVSIEEDIDGRFTRRVKSFVARQF